MTPLVTQLIDALRCLPGVGAKTAQRMAFHLLEKDRKGAEKLVLALSESLQKVANCSRCRTLSELNLCQLCANPARLPNLLCIVESPLDILSIEQTASFKGLYFVLMGHLSPLDGLGPKEIGLDLLAERLRQEPIDELIIATGTTVEGEATAHFIADMAREQHIKTTRIAHGVPVGGNLEYVDGITLAQAFSGRVEMV